jgi:hypothetical protein
MALFFGIHRVNTCVNFDPDEHVFYAFEFFFKLSVTKWFQSRVYCRTLA